MRTTSIRALLGLLLGIVLISAGATTATADNGVDTQLEALAQSGTDVRYWKADSAAKDLDGFVKVVAPNEASRCVYGYICLYPDADGGGIMVFLRSGQSYDWLGQACFDGICYDLNDRMSSWENTSGWTYCWYWDAGFKGERRFMQYHGYLVINLTAYENDEASSVKALAPSAQQVRC